MKSCPKCGEKMIYFKSHLRKGKFVYDPYYRCSSYPNCKHVEKAS